MSVTTTDTADSREAPAAQPTEAEEARREVAAERARLRKERRAALKAARESGEPKAIAALAAAITPELKSAITGREVARFRELRGTAHPLEFVGSHGVDNTLAWARGGRVDPEVAAALKARTHEIALQSGMPKFLWGRKIAAIASAEAECL